MLSDRVQRQVDRLLDEADEAIQQRNWTRVLTCAQDVLDLDPENADARGFRAAAERALQRDAPAATRDVSGDAPASTAPSPLATPQPTSFCEGRYEVKRFLGEGGKKLVYLAHDSKLDRDVAFALIKTEGLDAGGMLRIKREAQAMGRLIRLTCQTHALEHAACHGHISLDPGLRVSQPRKDPASTPTPTFLGWLLPPNQQPRQLRDGAST